MVTLVGTCLSGGNGCHSIIGEFLQKNGGNFLEIGVYDGQGLCYMADTNPTVKIYGIDPFIADGNTGEPQGTPLTDHEKNCRANIIQYENISLFRCTSKEFSERLTDDMVKELNISSVYVDGSHHYDDVVIDIDLSMRLIGAKNGIVAFDDYNMADVKNGIDYGIKKYPNCVISSGNVKYYTVN